MSTIGPMPRHLQPRILKSLAQSFTHRDNPYGNSNPNIAFQRDLDEAMEADAEYRTNPSLPRLCHLLAELAYKWEKIESQSRRMSGSTSTQSSDTRKKTSSFERDRDRNIAQPNPISDTYCKGCNRPGHTREDCHHKKHPDFNHTGPWAGCRADRELRARGKTGDEIKLARGFRADGTVIPKTPSGAPAAPSPYRRNDSDEGAGRRRDNDRRDRDGCGSMGGTVAGAHLARSSRHDVPTSEYRPYSPRTTTR